MPRLEKRYYNFTGSTDTTIPESWTSAFSTTTQPQIAAGNTATTRTGEWITLTKLHIQGYFLFNGSTQYARILIVQVNESNVAQTPTIAIDDPAKSDVHWDSKRWARILYDRTFFPRGGALLPVVEAAGSGVNHPFKITRRIRVNQHYTGSAAANVGRGSIQVFVIGKNTAGANEAGERFDGYIVWHNQV